MEDPIIYPDPNFPTPEQAQELLASQLAFILWQQVKGMWRGREVENTPEG